MIMANGQGIDVGRRYRNPPVVEALCEMFFHSSAWDDAVVGQFYELVKGKFPKKTQRELHEAQVRFSTEGDAAAGVRRLPPRMQFVTEPGDRMIQLGRDLLVVNQLRPYPSFEDWEQTLHQALGFYRELAKPKALNRLGVRYIDRVIIPAASVQMEDYFTFYPEIPPALGRAHGAFMLRVELPNMRAGHKLLLTFGSAPAEKPGTNAFLLDFYDLSQQPGGIPLEDVPGIVREAHDNVVEAFEGCITDKLRGLFDPE